MTSHIYVDRLHVVQPAELAYHHHIIYLATATPGHQELVDPHAALHTPAADIIIRFARHATQSQYYMVHEHEMVYITD